MTAEKKEPSQEDKFIKAAREHGCDESEAEFERKLKAIAAAKRKEGSDKDGGS